MRPSPRSLAWEREVSWSLMFMSDWYLLSMLGMGFTLGLRHALDADHVAAVSTIWVGSSSIWRCSAIGLCWGLGHTLMLLLVGLVVIGFRVAIPSQLAQWFEFAVGLMLVVLGASLARTLLQERWHWHSHDHDGARHRHWHHHQATDLHHHPHWCEGTFKPFFVGMVHGLAGSAALLLIVMSAVETVPEALAYIGVFGVGSILGMLAVGGLAMIPMLYAESWGPIARWSVRGLVSIGSVAVGIWTILETGIPFDLF